MNKEGRKVPYQNSTKNGKFELNFEMNNQMCTTLNDDSLRNFLRKRKDIGKHQFINGIKTDLTSFYNNGSLIKDGPVCNNFDKFQTRVQNAKIGHDRREFHNSYCGDSKYKFFQDVQQKAMQVHGIEPINRQRKPKKKMTRAQKIKAFTDPKDENHLSLSEYMNKKSHKTNKKLFYLMAPSNVTYNENPIIPVRNTPFFEDRISGYKSFEQCNSQQTKAYETQYQNNLDRNPQDIVRSMKKTHTKFNEEYRDTATIFDNTWKFGGASSKNTRKRDTFLNRTLNKTNDFTDRKMNQTREIFTKNREQFDDVNVNSNTNMGRTKAMFDPESPTNVTKFARKTQKKIYNSDFTDIKDIITDNIRSDTVNSETQRNKWGRNYRKRNFINNSSNLPINYNPAAVRKCYHNQSLDLTKTGFDNMPKFKQNCQGKTITDLKKMSDEQKYMQMNYGKTLTTLNKSEDIKNTFNYKNVSLKDKNVQESIYQKEQKVITRYKKVMETFPTDLSQIKAAQMFKYQLNETVKYDIEDVKYFFGAKKIELTTRKDFYDQSLYKNQLNNIAPKKTPSPGKLRRKKKKNVNNFYDLRQDNIEDWNRTSNDQEDYWLFDISSSTRIFKDKSEFLKSKQMNSHKHSSEGGLDDNMDMFSETTFDQYSVKFEKRLIDEHESNHEQKLSDNQDSDFEQALNDESGSDDEEKDEKEEYSDLSEGAILNQGSHISDDSSNKNSVQSYQQIEVKVLELNQKNDKTTFTIQNEKKEQKKITKVLINRKKKLSVLLCPFNLLDKNKGKDILPDLAIQCYQRPKHHFLFEKTDEFTYNEEQFFFPLDESLENMEELSKSIGSPPIEKSPRRSPRKSLHKLPHKTPQKSPQKSLKAEKKTPSATPLKQPRKIRQSNVAMIEHMKKKEEKKQKQKILAGEYSEEAQPVDISNAFNKCSTDHEFQYRNHSMTARCKFRKGDPEKIQGDLEASAINITGKTINAQL